MTERTPTSGPHSADVPLEALTRTVSTDDLADHPVGTMIVIDGEVMEMMKRVQTDDGVRVHLWPVEDGRPERAVEVARADCAEPLWQVVTGYDPA